MRLKDKVALITGAASGIAKATAELFAREGAVVRAADAAVEAGNETVACIQKDSGRASFARVDVSNSQQVAHVVDSAIEAFGRIDILFNGAAILAYGTVVETDEAMWNRMIAINLTGTFLCCRAVVPHMIRQGADLSSTSRLRPARTMPPHERSLTSPPKAVSPCSLGPWPLIMPTRAFE